MTDGQIGLLLLIKSALTGEAVVVPTDFDIPEAFDTAKVHGITALAYYGACKIGEDPATETMKRAFASVCKCILADERQRAEISRLFDAFDKRGFRRGVCPCAPLTVHTSAKYVYVVLGKP